MKIWQIGNYRQVFQFKSFRLFWLGFTFSILGDTMTRVALTWFVYETTNSVKALGLLTLFYTGPVIVGGLLAGWLLDHRGPETDRVELLPRSSVIRPRS